MTEEITNEIRGIEREASVLECQATPNFKRGQWRADQALMLARFFHNPQLLELVLVDDPRRGAWKTWS